MDQTRAYQAGPPPGSAVSHQVVEFVPGDLLLLKSIIDWFSERKYLIFHTTYHLYHSVVIPIGNKEGFFEKGSESTAHRRPETPGLVSTRGLVIATNFLLFAGHETIANLIGTGMYYLMSQPEQMAQLQADSSKFRRPSRNCCAMSVRCLCSPAAPHRM